MAGVNVKRKGTGAPERLACFTENADGSLYGKCRHRVGFSLWWIDEKPRFSSIHWWSFAASCRGVAVSEGVHPRLMSEGVPVALSVLRKQAKPGWRTAADGQ